MTKRGPELKDIKYALAFDLTEWPMEGIHPEHARGHR
jgi:hypothetical protein